MWGLMGPSSFAVDRLSITFGKEYKTMDATKNINQRLTTILLVLLIILLALLIIGIVAGFLMMNGGMSTACLDMMRNFQTP